MGSCCIQWHCNFDVSILGIFLNLDDQKFLPNDNTSKSYTNLIVTPDTSYFYTQIFQIITNEESLDLKVWIIKIDDSRKEDN